MSFKHDFDEARKRLWEQKEKELQKRAELKEESIAEAVLEKARAEELRKKHLQDQAIQNEIDTFNADKNKSFKEQYEGAMAEKNASLFKEYIESARADHLDDAVRTGILEGSLPIEDVQKVYSDSIGDWNPNIKGEEDFSINRITEDYGYNSETGEMDWFMNKVGDMDEDDIRNSISIEQLHSEVGQGNISEYTNLWNKDYETPDYVDVTMPDGSVNRISNDAWLSDVPDHKVTGLSARIDAKRDEDGNLVNPVNNYTSDEWRVVDKKKMNEAGFVTDDYGEQYGTSGFEDRLVSGDAKEFIEGVRANTPQYAAHIYQTSIERMYSPEEINDGTARLDYEEKLRNFGGYSDEEVAKKLQAFDLHSMYDTNVTMNNKYGWLPGAVSAFDFGINLNNKSGWSEDEWTQGNDDRFLIGSGTTLQKIPGTDRLLVTGTPIVPREATDIEYDKLTAFNKALDSSYPDVDTSHPERFKVSQAALDSKLEEGFAERTIRVLSSSLASDMSPDAHENFTKKWEKEKHYKLRMSRFHDEFNENLIGELNRQIGDEGLTTEEARKIYEREGFNIPSASIRFREDFDKLRAFDPDKKTHFVSALYEMLGHFDLGYLGKEQFGAGKLLYNLFTSDVDGMDRDMKWAFYTPDNAYTGVQNKDGSWDRSKGAMSVWDINPGEGEYDVHNFLGTAIGLLADVYALRPFAALVNPLFLKGFSKAKPGFKHLLGPRTLDKLVPRAFVVKSAEYMTKFKDHSAAVLAKMSMGKLGYVEAQKIAQFGSAKAFQKAHKESLQKFAHTLGTKTFPQAVGRMNNLGIFYGVHNLAEQMGEHGVYNVKVGEALKEYGAGATVGAFLPAYGAFGTRLMGRSTKWLSDKTNMGISKLGVKAQDMLAAGTGLATEAYGFSAVESSVNQMWRHGVKDGFAQMAFPTWEEYAHSFATIAALKTPTALGKGFKNINDFAYKADKYKIKFQKRERKMIRDIMMKLHPDKVPHLNAKDAAYRDALIEAGKGDVKFWQDLKNEGMTVNLMDKIGYSIGIRPKSMMKIFNVKYKAPEVEGGKHEVLMIGPKGEPIEIIEAKNKKEAIELRTKTRQILASGEQMELPLDTTVDNLGNYDLVPSESAPKPVVKPSGTVIAPVKTKKSKADVKDLNDYDTSTREGLESTLREIDVESVKKMGTKLPYSQLSGLVKEYGLKPPTRSKTDMVSSLKEHYEASDLKDVDKIKPKTLSQRIDEAVIEREYGKDWKKSKNLEADLNEKYGVDSVEELSSSELKDFESDLAVKSLGKGFEVGSGPITPQNVKNVADTLIGTGRFIYNDLPKHLQKLGNKIGVDGTNFKEKFKSWTGETKTASGKFFKKTWNMLRKFYKGSKDYIKEYIKNPKIGLGIQEYGSDGKPLTLEQKMAAMKGVASKSVEKGKLGLEFEEGSREKRTKLKKVTLTSNEKAIALESNFDTKEVENKIRKTKALYPRSEGWLPIEAVEVTDKSGKPNVKYKTLPYNFHLDSKTGKAVDSRQVEKYGKKVEKGANKVVNEILEIAKRAKKGDANARTILKAVTWYSSLKDSLKRQYGSFVDAFIDLLGATSPGTAVKVNFRYSQEALQRMTRGDYDNVLSKFESYIESGKSTKYYLEKSGHEQIKKLNNELFGTNSNSASLALLDVWRQLKPGGSPKARTFSKNIAGLDMDMATIDVWAARGLQRHIGKGRIPPVAEGPVTGKISKAANAGIQSGGQFGLGQDIYSLAAEQLRDVGKQYNIKTFKNIEASGVQGIEWFAEKEVWAKNKWTSKAGEGGSFDLEMQEKPLSRYSLSLKESPDLTHKNFKGQKDLDNIKHPDIIASKALPSYTFKGGEMVESYDIEALIDTKSELGRGEYIKKAVEVAKKNNAKEIVFSEVLNFSEEITPLQSQKLANARPGVDLWFENPSDYKSALKIINKFKRAGFDGIDMVVEPRTKVTDAYGENKYMGVKFQVIPELALEKSPRLLKQWRKNPEKVVDWMQKQSQKIDKVAEDLLKRGLLAGYDMQKYNTNVIRREKFDEVIKNESGAVEEKFGSGQSLIQNVQESVRDRIIDIGEKDPKGDISSREAIRQIIDVDGLEAGMLGFTPQNFKILRRGLIDTGHFLYNDLPKYVRKAGEKVGVTSENYREKFKQFTDNPKSFGGKGAAWFKRVYNQMKNWFNKNRERLRENKYYRQAEDYVVREVKDYIKNPKMGMSIEIINENTPLERRLEILGERIKKKDSNSQRKIANQRALARIKISERSLLGEKIKQGKKYVQDVALVDKNTLGELQQSMFKQLPIMSPELKQITNLKELYREAQTLNNPMAELMLESYQAVLSSIQGRERALDLKDQTKILKKVRGGKPLRRDENKTIRERRIENTTSTSKAKYRDASRAKVNDPELKVLADKLSTSKPKQSRRLSTSPTEEIDRGGKKILVDKKSRLEKAKGLGKQLLRTEKALDRYQQETGLPVYDMWLDYRHAKGERDFYREKHLEPINKAAKELGYSDIDEIPSIVGQRINNYRNGVDVDLSSAEMKLNNAITEIYENPDYQKDIAVNRYMQYKNGNKDNIPGVDKADIQMLDEFIEYGEYDNFFEAIGKVKGFVKENYNPQFSDILTQDLSSPAHTNISKGVLNPQDKSTLETIKNDPAKYGDAIKNLKRKINSDSNILHLDDIVTDWNNITNDKHIPSDMRRDLHNIMENDLNVADNSVFGSFTGRTVGRLMAAVLSSPVKWARNSLQRFMALSYANVRDMPSMFADIVKESFGKGSFNIRKSSTFLNAPEKLRRFFMSNTSSESALYDEYLRVGKSKWLDKYPSIKEKIDGFKSIYGFVDLSSRWVDFHSTWKIVDKQLRRFRNGEVKFSQIRDRIFFDSLDTSLKRKLIPEIDNGNIDYVSMQIADHIAATKSQFRYQKMERSLLEHSTEGRMWMYAQNYPLRFLGNYTADFKNVFYGMPFNRNVAGNLKFDPKSADYNQFKAGLKGVVGRTVLMGVFEEMLNRMFGYRDKYGWGYRYSSMLSLGAGGLLTQVISFAGDLSGDVADIFSAGYDRLGGKEDAEKNLEKSVKALASSIEHISKKQIVGLELAISMAEAIWGVEHKQMKVLRTALTKAGWDDFENMDVNEKRTFWQMVQKILGGTGHTKEQAVEWEEMKGKRGRKKRRRPKEDTSRTYLNY